jgi:hypothetical protein
MQSAVIGSEDYAMSQLQEAIRLSIVKTKGIRSYDFLLVFAKKLVIFRSA